VNNDLRKTLGALGAVCIIAATVGGGVKLAGSELPVVGSIQRQLLLGAVGGLLLTLAILRRSAPVVTFLVEQKMSSISAAAGSIGGPHQMRTAGGGTKVRRIIATGYERSRDGKTYRFFDRRNQTVQELPSYQVNAIRRAEPGE
jgi:hypothetical protein